MSELEIEYRGLIAEHWDLLRGDTSKWSSRPFFLDVIRRSGQPALDVACGTGRLLLDYLGEGIDVDGVDIAPEMIAICRKKAEALGLRPNLYVQAMEALDLPRKYRTIIVPSSSFLQMTDVDDMRRALKRFLHHLEPGGILSMSMRVLDPDPAEEEFQIEAEAVRPADGALIRRWWRCWYDVPERLQHTEDRYEIIVDGEIVASETYVRSPALTWLPPTEALALLEDAGFVNVYGVHDFTDRPLRDDDRSFVVFGARG
ncbi:MAG: class I SAM-dependent methyltransferase [Chloroflexota bacterium]|nr:MAG: class I SAM-dependent methyltransferase [Chloroflexota bacterium]